MSITVSNINTIMLNSICKSYDRTLNIKKQRDVQMSTFVNSYPSQAASSTATVHFVVQVGFSGRKDTVVFIGML